MNAEWLRSLIDEEEIDKARREALAARNRDRLESSKGKQGEAR